MASCWCTGQCPSVLCLSVCLPVCLSVCLSVWLKTLWTLWALLGFPGIFLSGVVSQEKRDSLYIQGPTTEKGNLRLPISWDVFFLYFFFALAWTFSFPLFAPPVFLFWSGILACRSHAEECTFPLRGFYRFLSFFPLTIFFIPNSSRVFCLFSDHLSQLVGRVILYTDGTLNSKISTNWKLLSHMYWLSLGLNLCAFLHWNAAFSTSTHRPKTNYNAVHGRQPATSELPLISELCEYSKPYFDQYSWVLFIIGSPPFRCGSTSLDLPPCPLTAKECERSSPKALSLATFRGCTPPCCHTSTILFPPPHPPTNPPKMKFSRGNSLNSFGGPTATGVRRRNHCVIPGGWDYCAQCWMRSQVNPVNEPNLN